MIKIVSRATLPLGFFIFISYIIFLANSANYNFAFRVIGDIAYGDKIMHGLLYGVMAFLLNYSLRFKSIKNIQLGTIIVLVFSTIEEFSQIFIASRTFNIGDLIANFIGIFLFSMIGRR